MENRWAGLLSGTSVETQYRKTILIFEKLFKRNDCHLCMEEASCQVSLPARAHQSSSPEFSGAASLCSMGDESHVGATHRLTC